MCCNGLKRNELSESGDGSWVVLCHDSLVSSFSRRQGNIPGNKNDGGMYGVWRERGSCGLHWGSSEFRLEDFCERILLKYPNACLLQTVPSRQKKKSVYGNLFRFCVWLCTDITDIYLSCCSCGLIFVGYLGCSGLVLKLVVVSNVLNMRNSIYSFKKSYVNFDTRS